ncbi:MAG TPA: uroporphyrinogen-III C-methyltransferase [Burkholderiaceae bacterium]|nr:uroporphyrinogen-III C-methyltransferase [Burkholderiaceae bacterium]
MNETPSTPDAGSAAPERPARMAPAAPAAAAPSLLWLWVAVVVVGLVGVVAIGLVWQTLLREHNLEQELVRRQQMQQEQASEAQMLAKQAQDSARESATKVSLLDARLSEVTVQRGQIEELIQSLSRARDENIVVDIDAGLRVAMQQSALTGSAEPLVAALKQADERLARYNQPRLEGVRRAIARDLDRVKGEGMVDVVSLTIKLDEVVRMVDDLPLRAQPDTRRDAARTPPAAPASAARARKPAAAASAPSQEEAQAPQWLQPWLARWDLFSERVWVEAKSLVRVERIENPEAMLLEPDHVFFLRENLKLRLLNARLALLARQFTIVQSDLQGSLDAIERYFDPKARRTQLALSLIRQVQQQARHTDLPRPDNTLAALATAAAGR